MGFNKISRLGKFHSVLLNSISSYQVSSVRMVNYIMLVHNHTITVTHIGHCKELNDDLNELLKPADKELQFISMKTILVMEMNILLSQEHVGCENMKSSSVPHWPTTRNLCFPVFGNRRNNKNRKTIS